MELVQSDRVVDPDHEGQLNDHRQATSERAHAVLFIDFHRLLLKQLRLVFILLLNLFHHRLQLLHLPLTLIHLQREREGDALDDEGDECQREPVAESGDPPRGRNDTVHHLVLKLLGVEAIELIFDFGPSTRCLLAANGGRIVLHQLLEVFTREVQPLGLHFHHGFGGMLRHSSNESSGCKVLIAPEGFGSLLLVFFAIVGILDGEVLFVRFAGPLLLKGFSILDGIGIVVANRTLTTRQPADQNDDSKK
jgi:hypothetical protein